MDVQVHAYTLHKLHIKIYFICDNTNQITQLMRVLIENELIQQPGITQHSTRDLDWIGLDWIGLDWIGLMRCINELIALVG